MPRPSNWATDNQMTYYHYLQRRYRAGEEGPRLTMEQVQGGFDAIEGLPMPLPRGGPEQKVLEEACALLYIDPAQYLKKPEEAKPSDAGEA